VPKEKNLNLEGYIVEPLGSNHDREAFSCGEATLDKYVKEQARQDFDFYEVVKKRLNTRGVFAQWFHFYGLGEEEIRLQARTFCQAFEQSNL